MPKNNIFNFEYSYLTLPSKFYTVLSPASFHRLELVLHNHELSKELDVPVSTPEELVSALFENKADDQVKSFSQAYAGHQFGHFTRLGDGRAVVIGEHVTDEQKRFDIQLKGGGRTPYSRGGDGKATLKSMLREYLMSEAIHHLKIPGSRSLALLKTGEPVYRETEQQGAVLARVMKSHIRVGTFEFAAYFGTPEDLKALTKYTIQRLYPELEQEENQALALLKKVMTVQMELVANWMRVGFIHGVMNTDNVSIGGETFDYGPCAFMNSYDPKQVYSSIDTNGRYAYGNQPMIIKWNLIKFAESLLPVIHEDKETSIKLAQAAVDEFDEQWKHVYYKTMLDKLGIEDKTPELFGLVDELLELMKALRLDYTNTFLALSGDVEIEDNPLEKQELSSWLKKWKDAVEQHSNSFQRAKGLMRENNPVVIPRNHLVEKALDQAVEGDFSLFEQLQTVLATPYRFDENHTAFMKQPDSSFEMTYQTFCGT